MRGDACDASYDPTGSRLPAAPRHHRQGTRIVLPTGRKLNQKTMKAFKTLVVVEISRSISVNLPFSASGYTHHGRTRADPFFWT